MSSFEMELVTKKKEDKTKARQGNAREISRWKVHVGEFILENLKRY